MEEQWKEIYNVFGPSPYIALILWIEKELEKGTTPVKMLNVIKWWKGKDDSELHLITKNHKKGARDQE